MKIQKKDLKFIVFDNLSRKEISLVMSAVKQALPNERKNRTLVFATSTERSKKMTLEELTEDIGEDHLYLLENPPEPLKSPPKPSENTSKPRS